MSCILLSLFKWRIDPTEYLYTKKGSLVSCMIMVDVMKSNQIELKRKERKISDKCLDIIT